MATIKSREGRRHVIERLKRRDGPDCFYCGVAFDEEIPDRRLTLDHFVPRLKGGRAGIGNLRLACYGCNHLKGEMEVHAFLRSDRLAARRKGVTRRRRIELGLHPLRPGFWHTRIVRVKPGHLSCLECGADGSPDRHLDDLPCLAYSSGPRIGLGF